MLLTDEVGLALFFCLQVLGDGEQPLPRVPIVDGGVFDPESVLLEVIDELPFGSLVHLMLRLCYALFESGSGLFGRVVLPKHLADHLDELLLLVHGKVLRLIVGVVHGLVLLSVVVLAESHKPRQIYLIQIQGGQHSQFFFDLAVVSLRFFPNVVLLLLTVDQRQCLLELILPRVPIVGAALLVDVENDADQLPAELLPFPALELSLAPLLLLLLVHAEGVFAGE